MTLIKKTIKRNLFLLMLISACGFSAKAQNTLGGHIGFVQPIVTFQDGETTDGFDPYVVGFPVGITIRKSDNFAFDLEFIPFIGSTENEEGESFSAVTEFVIHPGALWGLGNSFTFGNRLAFETQSKRYGITPLLNKGFVIGKTNVFAEFVLPIRVGGDQEISVTAGLHFGIGF